MQLNLNHDLNRYCTVCNFGHKRMVPQSFLLYTLLPVPARCELKIESLLLLVHCRRISCGFNTLTTSGKGEGRKSTSYQNQYEQS